MKIHSTTSLITNSSTVIFTNHKSSIDPFKNLIDEILKLMGETKTCDELFEVSTLPYLDMVWDRAVDRVCDEEMEPWYDSEAVEPLKEDLFQKFFNDVYEGKEEKPDWLKDCELGGDYEYEQNDLIIKAKDPKYQKLADLTLKFLHSPIHEGSYG
jgi:hypothetical protein